MPAPSPRPPTSLPCSRSASSVTSFAVGVDCPSGPPGLPSPHSTTATASPGAKPSTTRSPRSSAATPLLRCSLKISVRPLGSRAVYRTTSPRNSGSSITASKLTRPPPAPPARARVSGRAGREARGADGQVAAVGRGAGHAGRGRQPRAALLDHQLGHAVVPRPSRGQDVGLPDELGDEPRLVSLLYL